MQKNHWIAKKSKQSELKAATGKKISDFASHFKNIANYFLWKSLIIQLDSIKVKGHISWDELNKLS